MKRHDLVWVNGAELRALRLGMGLRQADLAVLAGIDTSYLSMLETGRRPRASVGVATGLARALAVDPTSIIVS
ncbi:helix-turn-helix domain-containing protein [Actinomadura rayongensis]|uniref:Helix-turn-helix domain-containing protein n=1 Tax=Actinomadura rayongensis TaxID=1429076 RepID=A0A6I4WA64_9ACTN|nr:helix-turn-helix transcriptional regulator [Actinomadura rayongensis]MXQ63954.1 helix-turn-helix domain-containing protein [Actinomadura rayongensis]